MAERSEPQRRYTFPRHLRMRRRAEFERVFSARHRCTDARLTLWAAPNGLPYSRLGLVVGRRLGRAVQRNRIKRLWREAFRLSRHELPQGLDLVCAPRPGPEPSLAQCIESLTRLAERLQRKGLTAGIPPEKPETGARR